MLEKYKFLMIGAHQDDNEFRCGGLAAKLVERGHEVRFLSMCNGCGGHHILGPDEIKARRAKESAAVAEFLGIQYDIWDIDDCNITADLATRKKLIRYIREYSPDVVIAHRPNDYHADHRTSGQLVQDASYLLTVPNECPDVKAMKKMPAILYNEDEFSYPPFVADIVIDIDDVVDKKLKIADMNVSQVYEWLAYEEDETVPEDEAERFEWLKGMNITADTTDEEIMSAKRGYAVRFAKPAARFRSELINKYGEEKGSRVRYAEAFQICEYGRQLDREMIDKIFSF